MRVDNYTRAVLTIIAIALVYLCVRQGAPPVSAQAAATRVVITGIELEKGDTRVLPVGIVGEMRATADGFTALPVHPVPVRVSDPVDIRASTPIKIEADHPLPVRAVKEPGTQRPGPDR